MNFEDFLIEEEDNLDNIHPGSVPISLMFGRYQPFHLGHLKVINSLLKEYPKYRIVIGIVKGKKSSKDKTRNPFSFELQKELIEKSLGPLLGKVVVFPRSLDIGYTPYMIKEMRKDDYEIKVITAGADRAGKYSSDIQKLNDQFKTVNIDFHLVGRELSDVSASKVRDAISQDDFKTFKKLTSPNIHKYYRELQGRV